MDRQKKNDPIAKANFKKAVVSFRELKKKLKDFGEPLLPKKKFSFKPPLNSACALPRT
jgi:hypothetical protein